MSLRRAFAVTLCITATLVASFPAAARAEDDIRTAGASDVRELPALPAELAAALASPEVTAALGGPADAVRATAAEIGPEHVLAAWAPSITDPRAAVAVARTALGELRVVTLQEDFPGTLRVATGGGTATLRIQSVSDGQPLEIASQTRPTGATSAYWDCFSACFISRAPQCVTPCLECKQSGFTQCGLCYICLGYWGVYCAVAC
jgi:hypothetical protein